MAVIPVSLSSPTPRKESFDLKENPVEVEHVEGTIKLFDDNGNVRKIPVPSDDPADPLTWSTWRRCMVLISLCVFGTAGFGVVQSTPLFFSEIIAEYKRETKGVSIRRLIKFGLLLTFLRNFFPVISPN